MGLCFFGGFAQIGRKVSRGSQNQHTAGGGRVNRIGPCSGRAHRVRVEFLAGRLLLAFYSSFRWTPTFSVLLGFAGLLSNTFSVLLEIAIDAHAHAHAMCRHGNPAPHNLGAPSPWPFFRSSIPGPPPCDASELVDWQAPATAQCVHRLLLAHHIQPCRPRRCSHRGAHDAQAPQQAFTG